MTRQSRSWIKRTKQRRNDSQKQSAAVLIGLGTISTSMAMCIGIETQAVLVSDPRLNQSWCDPSAIGEFFPDSKFVSVSGDCDPSEFHKKVSKLRTPSGGSYDLNRYYTGADELFVVDGKTYAVTNQWGRKRLPALNDLIKKYPEAKVSYTPSMSESEESLE